jgi:uncharacterized RDD family membrane protein YckC
METYPTLQKRYLSTTLDGVLILFAVVIIAIAYQGDDSVVLTVRGVIGVLLILSYEPVLTSKLCTVGQAVIGIRVRRLADPDRKISLGNAYLRTALKALLGAISLFAMGFNPKRRAIHDLAARSVVVELRTGSEVA